MTTRSLYHSNDYRAHCASAASSVTSSAHFWSLSLPIILTPTCQLCRLLYCILPRDIASDDLPCHLEPYRSSAREFGWETMPAERRKQSAIHLGLATVWTPFNAGVSEPLREHDPYIRLPGYTGPAIGMQTAQLPTERSTFNAKIVESKLDVSLLLKALEHCQESHGSDCSMEKPAEILTTLTIDVEARVVVPCPKDCDYIALSYVRGGIQTLPSQLADYRLPRTIEDAITITKALKRRHLLVRARPSTPTSIDC